MDRRSDLQQAKTINAAVHMDALWGCVSAWHYLRDRGIGPAVAVRVLSKDGPRRGGDFQHPAVRDALAREPETGIEQRGGEGDTETRRTNAAAALAVERAIDMAAVSDRHYAESLLRIYGLDTATVMRVLFEAHRRRRRALPQP